VSSVRQPSKAGTGKPVHHDSESTSSRPPSGYSPERNLEVQKRGPVYGKLLAGTEALPESKVLDAIMHNFSTIGFAYESTNRKGEAVLDGALSGDCRTLADAFAAIAQAIGFAGAKTVGVVKDFMTGPGRIVDPRWGTGNADRGRAWLFQNHYWLDHNGAIYDVLFNRRKIDLGVTRSGAPVDDPETGLTYEIYGGTRYYAGWINGQYERYLTLSPQELEKIISARRKSAEQVRETTTSSESTDTKPSPAETTREAVEWLDIPQELKKKTEELLMERFSRASRSREDLNDWLEEQTDRFLIGTNPFNKKFDESKWREWAG
jgi:hypothetical protein